MSRKAGILLPLFSLPSPHGIGGLGKCAYEFVDFLAAAGQSVWQILPIGATGMGDSPYQTFSAFGGNPYFIDPDALAREGLLTQEEIALADLEGDPHRVDYAAQYRRRMPLLRLAWRRSLDFSVQTEKSYGGSSDESKNNLTDEGVFGQTENSLADYALFMALKDAHKGAPWWEWEEPIRRREPSALAEAKARLADSIGFHLFLQQTFFRQWDRLKAYAHARGVAIMGDIPIYTALDSADVWAAPHLFRLDGDLRPTYVAGCPPDGFSPTGQLWGNPLYRWEAHRNEGYDWWIRRFAHCMALYDCVRIDHFRGFDAYFAIPYGDSTAVGGHWEKGVGIELFDTVKKALPHLSVVAEDLGFITPSVKSLLEGCSFPGMRVLQFAFDSRDEGEGSIHLPPSYPKNCVAYTGTHDNQTLMGWLSILPQGEKESVRAYLGGENLPDTELADALIDRLLASPAELAIIPLPDWLHLGDEARINTPSTVGDNWVWRLERGQLSADLARTIREKTQRWGR